MPKSLRLDAKPRAKLSQRPPADPSTAFEPVGAQDLEQILCHLEERVVGCDNTGCRSGTRRPLLREPKDTVLA